jgi:hypothetical protein
LPGARASRGTCCARARCADTCSERPAPRCLAHFVSNLFVASPQGPILFASAAQIAFLLALGLYRLVGGEGRMLPLTVTVVLALLALDVYCLRGVLVPAYWEAAGN